MKTFKILTFLSYSFATFCFGQSGVATTTKKSLPSFKVILLAGGYSNETYEMHVYQKGNKYYADNILPLYYYGKKTDGILQVELNEKQIGLCETFLNSTPKCNHESVAEGCELYVIVAQDTIHLEDDCSCNGAAFWTLQNAIFAAKFKELEKKKAVLLKDLNRKLKGKWCIEPFKEKPKAGDYIVMIKADKSKCENYLQFGENYFFKSSSKKGLDLSNSSEYKLLIDKAITIYVDFGIEADAEGIYHLAGDDANFNLDTINFKELRVQFIR